MFEESHLIINVARLLKQPVVLLLDLLLFDEHLDLKLLLDDVQLHLVPCVLLPLQVVALLVNAGGRCTFVELLPGPLGVLGFSKAPVFFSLQLGSTGLDAGVAIFGGGKG